MRASLTAVLLMLGLVAAPHVFAAGDPARGKGKVTICQACHGPDGNSPYNPQWEQLSTQDLVEQTEKALMFRSNPVWPKLAGQNEKYIATQLAAFKEGKRRDPIMSGMSGDLSVADIEDIAAYYASQVSRPERANHGTSSIQRGAALYREGNAASGVPACMTCHGPRAHGTATLPRLAGQHTIYLKKQLWAFKSGGRANSVMSVVVVKLTEADIDDVVRYLSSLE